MATAVAATTAMVAAAAIAEAPKRTGAVDGEANLAAADPSSSSSPSPPAAAALAPTTKPTPKQKDLLDTTVAYLKQREGIDKTLKIIRYTARLVAATAPPESQSQQRCENLQASLGSARKAYRLGKFLQHVSAWRRLNPIDWRLALTDPLYRQQHRSDLLERLATLGEGSYYFLDQLAFYFKAGAFGEPRKGPLERRLSRLSAWAESLGYACNIVLGLARVRELAAAEAALRGELVARYRASGGRADSVPAESVARLRRLRAARRLRSAAIAQDAADSLLAISDLLDGKGGALGRAVSHPALLALCGLLSAAVSTQKNWAAVAG
jgi:hypothetical protein